VVGGSVVDGRVALSTGVVLTLWCHVDTGSVTLRYSQTRRQLSSVRNRFALPLQPPYVNERQTPDDTS